MADSQGWVPLVQVRDGVHVHALQLKYSHSSWSHQNMVTSLACWGPAWLTTACSSSFYRSLPSWTFLIGHRTPCTLRRPFKDDLFMQKRDMQLLPQSCASVWDSFSLLLPYVVIEANRSSHPHIILCTNGWIIISLFWLQSCISWRGKLTCSIRTHGVHKGAAPMPQARHGMSIQSHGKPSTRVYKSSTHVRPLLLQSYWSQ